MPKSNSHYTSSSPVAHPFCVPCYADTGVSGTYLIPNPSFLSDPAPPLNAKYPNGNSMISNKKLDLDIVGVLPSAKEARVLDDLTNNLLPIGQLCDHDCEATFTKNDMTVTNADGQIVLTASRDFHNGVWVVNVPITLSRKSPTHSWDTWPQHLANGIIRAKTTATDLVNFLHRSLGSPSISKHPYENYPNCFIFLSRRHNRTRSSLSSQEHRNCFKIDSTRHPIHSSLILLPSLIPLRCLSSKAQNEKILSWSQLKMSLVEKHILISLVAIQSNLQ